MGWLLRAGIQRTVDRGQLTVGKRKFYAFVFVQFFSDFMAVSIFGKRVLAFSMPSFGEGFSFFIRWVSSSAAASAKGVAPKLADALFIVWHILASSSGDGFSSSFMIFSFRVVISVQYASISMATVSLPRSSQR